MRIYYDKMLMKGNFLLQFVDCIRKIKLQFQLFYIIILYSVTSMVVLFAYALKFNILTRNGVAKNSTKEVIFAILIDLHNAINKMLGKIWFHKHCKIYIISY